PGDGPGYAEPKPRPRRFLTMTRVDDMRKQFEATIGNLTPARAQELAKGFLEPGAAKDQIAKSAADILEWSQRNRQRLRSAIQVEIGDQMGQVGGAPRDELDALRKRVRELERGAGMTAAGRRRAAAKKTTAKKPSAPERPAAPAAAGRKEGEGEEALGLEAAVGPVWVGRHAVTAEMARRRLDTELVRRGLAATLEEAQEAVDAGRVTVGGIMATKAATMVAGDAPVEVITQGRGVVSR